MKYRITIIAEANSNLTRTDLESQLVTSLFNIETEEKISDGETDQLEILEYELTDASPIC